MVTWTTGITVTFTYDANGNELSASNGLGFAYNAKDQTISVTGIFGAQLSMGYADAGQAERTSAGGSAYVNSALGVGSETKSGQTTYYTRTPGGHLISQRTAGGTYYYLFNGLGSVVGMVDASGNIVARYGYDPYGQMVQKRGRDASPSDTSVADGNPFRYTGAYLDATGFYKMGARYYDPARGRFTQLDPLGGGYMYASDNPINFVDPTGLYTDDYNGPPRGIEIGSIGTGDPTVNAYPAEIGASGHIDITIDFDISVPYANVMPYANVYNVQRYSGGIAVPDFTTQRSVTLNTGEGAEQYITTPEHQSFQATGSINLPSGDYVVIVGATAIYSDDIYTGAKAYTRTIP